MHNVYLKRNTWFSRCFIEMVDASLGYLVWCKGNCNQVWQGYLDGIKLPRVYHVFSPTIFTSFVLCDKNAYFKSFVLD